MMPGGQQPQSRIEANGLLLLCFNTKHAWLSLRMQVACVRVASTVSVKLSVETQVFAPDLHCFACAASSAYRSSKLSAANGLRACCNFSMWGTPTRPSEGL